MKKIKKFIIEFINNLNRTQKLIAAAILLVVMILLVNFISNLSFKDTFIDYKNATATSLVEASTVTTNRDLYLIMEDVVTDFLNTNIGSYLIDNKEVKLKDYYDYALYEEYKYNMSYGKFKKIANNFYSKIFNNKNEKYVSIPLDVIIDNIYVFSEPRNMYIVKINSNTEVNAYMGIELNESNEKYTIFYLE